MSRQSVMCTIYWSIVQIKREPVLWYCDIKFTQRGVWQWMEARGVESDDKLYNVDAH